MEEEFNLTLIEACEFLGRSERSISRYIQQQLLHPQEIKSAQGTLKWLFSKADLQLFKTKEKPRQEQTSHDKKGHDKNVDETSLLNPPLEDKTSTDTPDKPSQDETIVPFLLDQIKVKDEQIKILGGQMTEMIERNRETNILMRGLHETLKLNEGKTDKTRQPEETEIL